MQALTQIYLEGGRTRSLLQMFSHEYQLHPSNLTYKNNVALMALLLNAQEFKPHELALEVYQQAPTNAIFASTYTLSLLLQKKNADVLKIMEGLDPQALENPTVLRCKPRATAPRPKNTWMLACKRRCCPSTENCSRTPEAASEQKSSLRCPLQ